ncbi:MAG: sugar transferase [Bacteroidales bacterium]
MDQDKLNILYIGNDRNIIMQFSGDQATGNFIHKPNAIQAYKWLNNHNPDAILCEFVLPGTTGFEVFSYLKKASYQKDRPIILLHDKNSEGIREQALNEKVDDLYIKPVSSRAVISRIRAMLRYGLHNTRSEAGEKQDLPVYRIPLSKRIFDIVFAGSALLALSPVLVLVMLAIRLESKGKVYYVSQRVGTGYRVFPFYKFRSMYTGADVKLKEIQHLNQYGQAAREDQNAWEDFCPECSRLGKFCSPVLIFEGREICERRYLKNKKEQQSAAFVKIKNDPRVTRVGRFIRNTSIDELPQLINVLKGHMSIVGNRPLPLYEAEQLTSDQWSERFMAPAGITGLWQVELRDKKGSFSDQERKELDNSYARNHSFWGDIKLILRTVPALLQKENK